MSVIAESIRIVLRDRIPSDLETYLRWMSTGQWRSYDAPWESTRIPDEEGVRRYSERFLETCDEPASPPRWATIENRQGKPLGWVTRYGSERFPAVCWVGIDICEDDHLDRGFGREALGLWIDHLFTHSDLHRIALDTWSLNPRMQRVAEILGFTCEGRARELIEWEGRWQDRLHYGLLREEWEQS